MLWLTIWFTVMLKIPAIYLAYVIWWAVKDPPQPAPGTPGGFGGGGVESGPPRRPRSPTPERGRGPHGSPERRLARTPMARRARQLR